MSVSVEGRLLATLAVLLVWLRAAVVVGRSTSRGGGSSSSSGSGSAGGGRSLPTTCERWNCPCAGSTRHAPRPSSSQVSKRGLPLVSTAHMARTRAHQLLQRLETSRFDRNSGHVNTLQVCLTQNSLVCSRFYVHPECDMTGLPYSVTTTAEQDVEAKLRNARNLLGTLAVFVEQARRDEGTRQGNPNDDLTSSIVLIEELGIYHLLCSLQSMFAERNLDWETHITQAEMPTSCRTLQERAPIDNRNYLIFSSLRNVLEQLIPSLQYLQQLDD